MAARLHPRTARPDAASLAALAADRDDWAHPAVALDRCEPGLADVVRSTDARRRLAVVAIALDMVPVAEVQPGGALVPIVLEPWQAWDVAGAEYGASVSLATAWNPVSWGCLHRTLWRNDAGGPAPTGDEVEPPHWHEWRVAVSSIAERFISGPLLAEFA